MSKKASNSAGRKARLAATSKPRGGGKPSGGTGSGSGRREGKSVAPKGTYKPTTNAFSKFDKRGKLEKNKEDFKRRQLNKEIKKEQKALRYEKWNKKTVEQPEIKNVTEASGVTRLNKYLANAGVCSRREADQLIATGAVMVNGKVVTEMGYKVNPTDTVNYGGQTLARERLVYLVINKPKDYVMSSDDPKNKRTVYEIIKNACKERVYPIGNLDRNTTGVLMFTNDGELTKRLTHPSSGVRKLYHVELDKALKPSDLDHIGSGFSLDGEEIKIENISYVASGVDKKQIGVEIYSGKNDVVRRMFEDKGYYVKKLDRVVFGSLTKKDLPKGRWRFLTESDVNTLRMVSSGKSKSKPTH